MTPRAESLTPEQLDDDQRAVYEAIAGGDRAKQKQHFPLVAGDGSLNGPFGLMLHAPSVGMTLQQLGSDIRFRADLSARVREIAILQVAHASGNTFEWWAHERIARAVGLTDDELLQLSVGSFSSEDPVESAAAAFCATLLGSSTVSDQEYAAASEVLAPAQLVELTTLVGYYRTLAQLMEVFGVGVPTEGDVGAS